MNCWDIGKVLSLIAEYQKRPILWKKSDKLYHNLLGKEKAWDELSAIFSIDKDTVKKKIDSLRGSRRREKNRILKSMRNGKGKKVYVSNWFAWKPLQFLDDPKELRPKTKIINESHENNGNKAEQESFDRVNSAEEPHLKQNLVDKSSARMTNSKKKIASPIIAAPKKKRKTDFFIQEAYNILREKTTNRKKDECGMFGDYIAEKLRKLEDRIRVTLQNQIHNLIFEAEVGGATIAVAAQIPSTSQTTYLPAEDSPECKYSFSNSHSSSESSPSSSPAPYSSFTPRISQATCEQQQNGKFNHTNSQMLNNKVT